MLDEREAAEAAAARRAAMLAAMGITAWVPKAQTHGSAEGLIDQEADGPESAAATTETAASTQSHPAPQTLAPMKRPAAPSGGDGLPRPDVSALDWPELAAAAASCQACGLCEGRRQAVFGVGSTQAQWLIVGEAPGEQEDLKGEPFVGPSGQLLDNMLAAINVSRAAASGKPEASAYIANAVKCRPPGNRNPEPAEMAACEPFLKRQIALLKPRIILAMGRFAVQSILQSSEPIGKLRGRVHQYEGVPLVVTYHPAYLLRNLPEKAKAWDDLVLAMNTFRQSGR